MLDEYLRLATQVKDLPYQGLREIFAHISESTLQVLRMEVEDRCDEIKARPGATHLSPGRIIGGARDGTSWILLDGLEIKVSRTIKGRRVEFRDAHGRLLLKGNLAGLRLAE